MRYKLTYNENQRHLHVFHEGGQLEEGYAPVTNWEPIDKLETFKEKMNDRYLGLQVCSPNIVPNLEDLKAHWETFEKSWVE